MYCPASTLAPPIISLSMLDKCAYIEIVLKPGIKSSPANPGDGSSFRIAVPFEVWDMEDPSGEPVQIDMDIYDRMQGYNAGDTVYVFNPFDRMYTHFMHHAYQSDGL